jgi:hypothetical protein
LTFVSKSPLLKLINGDTIPSFSSSGEELYKELLKTKYNIPQMLEEWLNSKNPLFRRFALTFSGKSPALALLDEDEKIRLSAEIKLNKKESV